MLGRNNQLIQRIQNHLHITHNGHIYTDIFANFGRVNIDMDNMSMRSKATYLACGSIIKPHPDSDNKVGSINCHIGMSHTMHSNHTVSQNMRFRETTNTQQCRNHRYLCSFSQLFKLVRRSGDDYPSAGDNNRPLSLVYKFRRLLDLRRMPLQCWFITR
ncbi:hypothetical protein ES708_34452 [subsurface metagenome]